MGMRYNHRPVPERYDKGFLDLELIRIQQGITEALTTAQATAVARVSRLTADRSITGAAFTSTLLSIPVAAGEGWLFRWSLWLGTSAGAAGGLTARVTFPAADHARGLASGIRSGSLLAQTSAASPLLFATAVANADYSAADTWLTVEASFDHFTAAGSVTLELEPAVGTETMIVRPASVIVAVQTFVP